DLRILSVRTRLVALISLGHQGSHLLGRRQVARRYVRGPCRFRGLRPRAHWSVLSADFWAEARASRSLASFSWHRLVLMRVPPYCWISSTTLSGAICRFSTPRAAV